MTRSPLDDFRALFDQIPPIDGMAREAAEAVFESAKVGGSKLADIAVMAAGLAGKRPSVARPTLALFAGTHGVARHRLSGRRLDATMEAVSAFGSGDAPANHLCAVNMVGLRVYDLALHLPTGDISVEPAMDDRTLAATLAFGMEAIAGGPDLMLLSAVRSAGDDVAAAALMAALLGGGARDWIEPGASPEAVELAERALQRHGDAKGDPLALIGLLGGREFAGIAGAIMAARIERMPVVLDGPVALAAAAALHAIDAAAVDHCLLAAADNPQMRQAATRIGLTPLLADGVAAGEGTAAVLASSIVKDALALYAGLAAHPRGHKH